MITKGMQRVCLLTPLALVCIQSIEGSAQFETVSNPRRARLQAELSTQSPAGLSDNNQDVMEKLMFYDSIYQGAISARGVVIRPSFDGSPKGFEQPIMSWRFSRNNSRIALVERITELPEFKYIPLPDGDDYTKPGVVTYDADRNMCAHVGTAVGISFENDRSSRAKEITSFKISPKGEVLDRRPPQYLQDVYGPDDNSLIVPVVSLQRVLGRGFSQCITEITEVNEGSAGILNVIGAGGAFAINSRKGTWHLTIDTASQYLVRSALFYVDNDSSPYITITNDEVAESGPILYPKRGEFKLRSTNALIEPTKYSIEFVRLETDESVFADCEQLNDDQGDSRTIQIDSRLEPQSIRFSGKATTNEAITPVSRFGLWAVVSIAMIFVGLSAFVCSFFKSNNRK